MDLGFAGLIEEIEKRFGKAVTTIMLGMLFLAVVLWALELVMSLFVEIDRLAATGNTGDLILSLLYRLGFLAVAAVALIGYLNLRAKKTYSGIDDAMDRLRSGVEKFQQDTQRFREEDKASKESISADMATLEAKIAEWEALQNKVESLTGHAEKLIDDLKERRENDDN